MRIRCFDIKSTMWRAKGKKRWLRETAQISVTLRQAGVGAISHNDNDEAARLSVGWPGDGIDGST